MRMLAATGWVSRQTSGCMSRKAGGGMSRRAMVNKRENGRACECG